MQDEDFEVDWNLEEFEFALQGPIFQKFEYEVFEKEDSYVDFEPSSSENDVKLEELSSLRNSVPFLAPQIEEIKPENSEPCAAALAIAANIPTPNPSVLSRWRNFISSAYNHPNIMAHTDVACLKELFILLGSDIKFKSVNILIDLAEKEKDIKPGFLLRPMLPSFQKAPIFTFAHVKDFVIETELKVCNITKYSIFTSMQKAVSDMVNFVIEFPEILYLEQYGFILDFFLKFGIRSDIIIDAVMRTQRRRRRSQKPASVLILKQARRLGKGRKEFLEKIMLRSPERKYDPTVPIIVEPVQVRQLRNRRTGTIEGEGTPADVPDSTSHSHCDVVTQGVIDMKANFSGRISASKIGWAKRKLFSETEDKTNVESLKAASKLPNGLVVAKRTTVPNVITQGKFIRKKFYKRRDKSLIDTPYTCTLCEGRSFAYKGNLVIHMKKHHSGVSLPGGKRNKREAGSIPPYSCPVCLVGYCSKYRCKTHMQHFHPECEDWEPICNIGVASPSKSKRNTRLNASTPIRENGRKRSEMTSATVNSPTTVEPCKHISENSSSFYVQQPATPAQDLNIEVENRINVAIEEMQLSTFNRVTRQHFRTAVV